MKKPKVTENYSGEYAYVCVGNRILGKDGVSEMIDALLVAKRRMNDELEHLDTNDLFVDNEQYESFVNDIEVVNKALIKAGCIDENR